MNQQEQHDLLMEKKICVECGEEIIEQYESLMYECDHCLRQAHE